MFSWTTSWYLDGTESACWQRNDGETRPRFVVFLFVFCLLILAGGKCLPFGLTRCVMCRKWRFLWFHNGFSGHNHLNGTSVYSCDHSNTCWEEGKKAIEIRVMQKSKRTTSSCRYPNWLPSNLCYSRQDFCAAPYSTGPRRPKSAPHGIESHSFVCTWLLHNDTFTAKRPPHSSHSAFLHSCCGQSVNCILPFSRLTFVFREFILFKFSFSALLYISGL